MKRELCNRNLRNVKKIKKQYRRRVGAKMNIIEKEIQVKDYLTKSNLPASDYVINPYVGCPHGCKYCYASFMKRFTGHKEEWGTFIDIVS